MPTIDREYYVVRAYSDGKTIGNHVWTSDIDEYIRREATAAIFPTTVVSAIVCDDFWTCDHHVDQGANPVATPGI